MKTLALFFLIITASLHYAGAETHACPFCSPHVTKNQSVYETEHLLVILDNAPRAEGHLLVVPKRHVAQADGLNANECIELAAILPKAVEVFKKAYDTDQYIILQKNGRKAFQSVFHVHFHLLPFQSQSWSDVFDVWPTKLSEAEFEEQLTMLRALFQNTDEPEIF